MSLALDPTPQLERLEREVNALMRCVHPRFREDARKLNENDVTSLFFSGMARNFFSVLDKYDIVIGSFGRLSPEFQPLIKGFIKLRKGRAEEMDEFEDYAVQHPFEMIDRAKGSPDPLTRVLALTVEYATALQLSKQHALSSSIWRG